MARRPAFLSALGTVAAEALPVVEYPSSSDRS